MGSRRRFRMHRACMINKEPVQNKMLISSVATSQLREIGKNGKNQKENNIHSLVWPAARHSRTSWRGRRPRALVMRHVETPCPVLVPERILVLAGAIGWSGSPRTAYRLSTQPTGQPLFPQPTKAICGKTYIFPCSVISGSGLFPIKSTPKSWFLLFTVRMENGSRHPQHQRGNAVHDQHVRGVHDR